MAFVAWSLNIRCRKDVLHVKP